MERELIISWIYKALELDLDDELYIPGETRENCRKVMRRFNKEIELLASLQPEKAGSLIATTTFKDRRHWVLLKRTLGNPFIGFVKKASGKKERIIINKEEKNGTD